nr:CRISPR-associated endonuclease Cas1 [Thermomonas flagellata]
MFINGCLGPLILSGESLAAWRPWLALFAAVGLGERLSFGQGRFQFASSAAERTGPGAAPLRLRRPLVIDSDLAGAHVGLADANLVVSVDGQPVRKLPLMRIDHLALHGPCQISTPLLDACALEGIPVLMGAPGQTPLVIVGQQAEAQRYRRLAAHHAAHQALDRAQRARLAARLVEHKLAACTWLVRQRYQPGDHRLLAQLERARQALARSERSSVVRGWEGWAARHYHRWLQRRLQPLGDFQVRRHYGQTGDLVNSLLNYGYGLLRNHLARGIRLAGLDPWLGVLHEANDRHEALVSDLMEPWRPHVDRLVLRWVGLKVIRPGSFTEIDGQLRLLPQARERMVQDFTRMLERPPRNGSLRLAARIGQMLDSYADAAARGMLGDWSMPMPIAGIPGADDEA